MAIYDKPVRLLMKDMAESFSLEKGSIFTKQQVLDWFRENYPKIKVGTISAHLIRLSTNARSRTHYQAKPDADDVFFQIDGSRFRLFDAENDPSPIIDSVVPGGDGQTIVEEDEVDEMAGKEFAYEKDLQRYLAKNLQIIEPGLRLFEEEGVTGVEFPAGGRFIDILALDKDKNLVVIELKVSRGYDRVIGQILRYVSWIRRNQADEGQAVRGIIVAREISEDLKLACSCIQNIELYEYQLSISLTKIEIENY